jgi:hypothetical protein
LVSAPRPGRALLLVRSARRRPRIRRVDRVKRKPLLSPNTGARTSGQRCNGASISPRASYAFALEIAGVISYLTVVHHSITASARADQGSPVSEDSQAHSVQTHQRRCENTATIEGRKSVAQSCPRRQIPTASRSSKCRLTTPPDRPRHPTSRIASASTVRTFSDAVQRRPR